MLINEFHITDTSTNGETIHVRKYDEATDWAVEVAGHNPRISKRLLDCGALQQENKYADSLLCQATTEQLIQFLASATGYRCKLTKKVKRQYSEATKEAMRERLAKMNSMRNAVFMGVDSQNQEFDGVVEQSDTGEFFDEIDEEELQL